MKLLKKIRKGFTLIELVVVIAVIAILSAIAVVSYVSITNSAHMSNDEQKVRQVNLAITAENLSGKELNTMSDVLEIVEAEGFIVENFKPESNNKKYEFAYSWSNRQFLILEKAEKVVFPKELKSLSMSEDIWRFASDGGSMEGEFSYYLLESASGSVSCAGGLDVGKNDDISSIAYSSTAEKNVIFKTRGGDLSINGSSTHAEHYGLLKLGTISAVSANTYVEHGTVTKLVVEEGAEKVVIEKGSMVYQVENESDNLVIQSKAYVGEVTGQPAAKGSASSASDAIAVITFDQLQSLALSSQVGLDLSGKTIQLQNDIDMDGKSWVPFGYNYTYPFSGTLDGNGKKIKNLKSFDYSYSDTFNTSANTSGKLSALIAFARGNVTIKNLTVECAISAVDGVGVSGLIGIVDNRIDTTILIDGCTVKGSIAGKDKVGGFIGSTYITSLTGKLLLTLKNCVNEAEISGTDTADKITARVGGFFGTMASRSKDTLIKFEGTCVNRGAVSSTKPHKGYLVGYWSGGNGSAYNLDVTGLSNTVSGLSAVGTKETKAEAVIITGGPLA